MYVRGLMRCGLARLYDRPEAQIYVRVRPFGRLCMLNNFFPQYRSMPSHKVPKMNGEHVQQRDNDQNLCKEKTNPCYSTVGAIRAVQRGPSIF